jgi:AcrR family transcriptional regulator
MAKKGRPAGFDRTEALQRAMELFWSRGYEGATLEDLQAAMGGISAPSLYNAFGSKEALFEEAVNLYVSTIAGPPACALQAGITARDSIEAMLRKSVESFSAPGKPHGCLLVSGAMSSSPANKGPEQYLRKLRQGTSGILEARLRRAVDEGELSPELDIAAVAAFYTTVAHGISVRAGDGASRAELMSAVDGAMAAWSQIVKPSPALGTGEA